MVFIHDYLIVFDFLSFFLFSYYYYYYNMYLWYYI